MKIIRRSMFETNSSAVHSLVYTAGFKLSPCRLKLKNGCITTQFGDFDKDYGRLTTQSEKLSYLVTLCTKSSIITKSDYDYYMQLLEDSYDFHNIEDDLKKHIPGMEKLVVKPSQGSNNHQTLITDLYEFLGGYNNGSIAVSPAEFILCDDIIVEMGRD